MEKLCSVCLCVSREDHPPWDAVSSATSNRLQLSQLMHSEYPKLEKRLEDCYEILQTVRIPFVTIYSQRLQVPGAKSISRKWSRWICNSIHFDPLRDHIYTSKHSFYRCSTTFPQSKRIYTLFGAQNEAPHRSQLSAAAISSPARTAAA